MNELPSSASFSDTGALNLTLRPFCTPVTTTSPDCSADAGWYRPSRICCEPAGKFGPAEDLDDGVQGSGNAVARFEPKEPPPWRISGIVHPALGGVVRLRDAGVVVVMPDGSALGLSCQELGGQTNVDLHRLDKLPPANQEALGQSHLVPSSKTIPFTLTLEGNQLILSGAGREMGRQTLAATPVAIALFAVGAPQDSVRISNLTLETARQ